MTRPITSYTSLRERSPASIFSSGSIVEINAEGYSIVSTSNGTAWASVGRSDFLNDRPIAVEFGIGTWQSEDGIYSSDGEVWVQIGEDKSSLVIAARPTVTADNGKLLINATVGALAITVAPSMVDNFGIQLVQASTGVISVVAGEGVTFIGTPLVTVNAGDIIRLIWVAEDTYIVKVNS